MRRSCLRVLRSRDSFLSLVFLRSFRGVFAGFSGHLDVEVLNLVFPPLLGVFPRGSGGFSFTVSTVPAFVLSRLVCVGAGFLGVFREGSVTFSLATLFIRSLFHL